MYANFLTKGKCIWQQPFNRWKSSIYKGFKACYNTSHQRTDNRLGRCSSSIEYSLESPYLRGFFIVKILCMPQSMPIRCFYATFQPFCRCQWRECYGSDPDGQGHGNCFVHPTAERMHSYLLIIFQIKIFRARVASTDPVRQPPSTLYTPEAMETWQRGEGWTFYLLCTCKGG